MTSSAPLRPFSGKAINPDGSLSMNFILWLEGIRNDSTTALVTTTSGSGTAINYAAYQAETQTTAVTVMYSEVAAADVTVTYSEAAAADVFASYSAPAHQIEYAEYT